jgi:cytochrome oxidase Cu insertion factor (SCO1/SenC/PrrC family)
MRLGVAILLGVCFLGTANQQDNRTSAPATAPAIGLPVGQAAPAFALHDQFDHAVSNETLRGENGTVLLFFRSADW